MTAASGDHMHGRASVEQHGFVSAAKIMEAETGEAQLAGAAHEQARYGVRVAEPGKIKVRSCRARKDQREFIVCIGAARDQ